MRYERLSEAEKARHPSIHHTGSVRGMKKQGFWGKYDVCVRCGQYIYNLSMVIGWPWRYLGKEAVLVREEVLSGATSISS